MGGWFLSRRDSTMIARHKVPGIMSAPAIWAALNRFSRSEPVLATVQAEELGQAVPASGEPVAVRSVEAPEPAVLVEDRQEEKEHREFEQTWTSFQFEIVTCPGCMAVEAEPYRRRLTRRTLHRLEAYAFDRSQELQNKGASPNPKSPLCDLRDLCAMLSFSRDHRPASHGVHRPLLTGIGQAFHRSPGRCSRRRCAPDAGFQAD
jgi:hypothetical protein